MKLSDKGRYAPAPTLQGKAAQRTSIALSAWPDVHARTHWLLGDETTVDGADFYLGENELGHIHLGGEAHVALPAPVVDALIEAGLGQRFPWSRGFVTFPIADAADVEHALWLFQLSYDRRRGMSTPELLRCVAAHDALSA